MTLDDALAAGEYGKAAELAAAIASPAAYRDAMVRIYEARQQKGPPVMPNDQAPQLEPEVKPSKRKNKLLNSEGQFQLEPEPEAGKVPSGVINELRSLRTAQNDAATDFREAIKIQADKHKVKPSALRRLIVALGNDKVDELNAEALDIERLIENAA